MVSGFIQASRGRAVSDLGFCIGTGGKCAKGMWERRRRRRRRVLFCSVM